MKKTRMVLLVLALAAACETSASGCDFLMQPEGQDSPVQEQVTASSPGQ